MGNQNEELTRNFYVLADFDCFQKDEEVSVELRSDCLAVEGEKELTVPYSEIRCVAHCAEPEARTADIDTSVPFLFGSAGMGAMVGEVTASEGIGASQQIVSAELFRDIFLVGYCAGSKECWILLRDTRKHQTREFAKELAARANTEVIHHIGELQEKAE